MFYVNFVLQLVFKHIIKYLRGSFIDLIYDFEFVWGPFLPNGLIVWTDTMNISKSLLIIVIILSDK